jgi:hypothetical protein
LVSGFQWAALHGGRLIDISLLWRQRYRFVLIDSTSGIGELGGLCAMMLPDKLVTVFRPAGRSAGHGGRRRALEYRKDSGDPRPLAIFPPSRLRRTKPPCGATGVLAYWVIF